MSAIVQGMENAMKEQMATFGGADKINIDKEEPPSYQDHKDFSPGITVKDAYALKEGSTLLKCISPEMSVYRARATYSREKSVHFRIQWSMGGNNGNECSRNRNRQIFHSL